MEMKTTGEWLLKSGSWAADAATPGLELERTALDYPVSPRLTRADLGSLMGACRLESNPGLHFPPEFLYCPASGKPLQPAAAPAPGNAWAAPYGGLATAESASSGANGLRQTTRALRLARSYDYTEHGDSDVSLVVPPPGDYEFFSATFGTVEAALVGLDSGKGTLFAWMPESKKWFEMECGGQRLLSESTLDRSGWRAEMAIALNSQLYLPTQQGLACVTPDVPSLKYHAEYFGAGPSVGAPIWFQGRVWAPSRTAGGAIEFVNIDLSNREGAPPRLENTQVDPGAVSLPVSYGRVAIWPCENGQLRLHKDVNGKVTASFIPWPAGIVPQFQFGSPFLSRDGSLWQLCFDSNGEGSYRYLKLGGEPLEQVPALGPRLCSGSFNYRFASKLKTEPWIEPELGDDASSNEIVIPLIESQASASVIGLKIESSAGLANVLESTDRTRARLVLDDETTEVVFHTIIVSQPWRLRLFCHQGIIWAYHPMLNRIDGWALQA